MAHGQAHHAGVATIHAGVLFRGHGNRPELWMLDRVCTRLVERIAGLYIGVDLFIRVVAHGHVGDAEIPEEQAITQTEQGNAGVDLMRMTTQTFEHRDGICTVFWFAQDVLPIDNSRIRCQDDLIGIRPDSARLGFSKS